MMVQNASPRTSDRPATEKQLAFAERLGIPRDRLAGMNTREANSFLYKAQHDLPRVWKREKRERFLAVAAEKGIRPGVRVRYLGGEKVYTVNGVTQSGTISLNGSPGAFSPVNLEVVG